MKRLLNSALNPEVRPLIIALAIGVTLITIALMLPAFPAERQCLAEADTKQAEVLADELTKLARVAIVQGDDKATQTLHDAALRLRVLGRLVSMSREWGCR